MNAAVAICEPHAISNAPLLGADWRTLMVNYSMCSGVADIVTGMRTRSLA